MSPVPCAMCCAVCAACCAMRSMMYVAWCVPCAMLLPCAAQRSEAGCAKPHVLFSACQLPHAVCYVTPRAACRVPCAIQRAPCTVCHGSFAMCHAPCRSPCATILPPAAADGEVTSVWERGGTQRPPRGCSCGLGQQSWGRGHPRSCSPCSPPGDTAVTLAGCWHGAPSPAPSTRPWLHGAARAPLHGAASCGQSAVPAAPRSVAYL